MTNLQAADTFMSIFGYKRVEEDSMNVAEFIMKIESNAGGHKETIVHGLSMQEAVDLVKELDKEYPRSLFYLKWFGDESGSIYEGYMEAGKGDRLILAIEN